ncbi:hypothetical protein [Elizabethkingia meningoseptica]|uniref:hypothetical protein n=1 Tax=Elizabethkingia meningoseptica TaxID=238 RepID=UPI0038924CD8
MRTILLSEIRKERCNAAALGLFNSAVRSGGSQSFDFKSELKKIGFNLEGGSVIGGPVRYTNENYFFTENYHPKELADYIKKNKVKIRNWAIANNRNLKSALLGY